MGYFAWEYQGQHADLDRAYRQLLQCCESLLNPSLFIVSDLQRIVIHTNFTNTVKRVHELALDDLLIPEELAILHRAFTDPKALRDAKTPEQVTEEAAAHFADDTAPELDADGLHILAEESGLDWAAIEPSVLGTLFDRSLDPGKRSPLGAHYTGKEDILLIIEPVLMAPLRRWAEVKAEAKAEKRELIAGS
jgi:hypothetical protein